MYIRIGSCLLRLAALALLAHALLAQGEAVARALASFQGGDFASAEQILRTELRAHPQERSALEVLAIVLDQEHEYSESDGMYRHLLAFSPTSPGLLNNYGNHLLSMGKPREAEVAFAKVLALKADHPNAAVQMARLALDRHAPAEARSYLGRIPAAFLDQSDVTLLRIRSDYELHRDAEADALLRRASAAANENAQQCLALGETLAAAGRSDKAVALFARSLELQPASFEALYDLGLATAHAGHPERAREMLAQALARQPQNVVVLSDLAAVELKLNNGEAALELLVRGRKLAPERTDIQLLLARTAAQLGYFGDAAQAWKAYLKLRPDDDIARRELAFAEMALAVNVDAAMAELKAYTRKHPQDPMGHFELAAAQCPSSPNDALIELNKTLALKPDFASAHFVRGLLRYQQNQPESAVQDFEKAAVQDPNNPSILERLGATYQALDRSADALRVLRQAHQLAPDNASVLLRLGRALTRAGETLEAAPLLARYREVRSTQQRATHPAGLVDFLSLPPDQQLARYRAGVERTIAANPENVEAQVRYLGLLLKDAKNSEAEELSRKITALEPSAPVLVSAVQELLEAGLYRSALEMLEQAARHGVMSSELQLDLAIAIDALDGHTVALGALDKIESGGRTGDYYLERARILEESGRPGDADESLVAALKINPKRPDLYRAVALLLLKKDRASQACHVLDRAVQNIPDDPQLRVMWEVAAALAGQPERGQFQQIESRWPEWSQAWVAHALILAAAGRTPSAQRTLETARALGATGEVVEICASEIELAARSAASGDMSDLRSRVLRTALILFR